MCGDIIKLLIMRYIWQANCMVSEVGLEKILTEIKEK